MFTNVSAMIIINIKTLNRYSGTKVMGAEVCFGMSVSVILTSK